MKKIFLLLLTCLFGQLYAQNPIFDKKQNSNPSSEKIAISPTKKMDAIDSLIMDKLLYGSSQLVFSTSFSNKTLVSGRDYGVRQTTTIPSISYYHPSGFYADLSGFAYSKSTPKYEFTAVSIGYWGIGGSKFLYSADLSRSFLTKTTDGFVNPFPFSLSVMGSYDIATFLAPMIDYTVFFSLNQGETSHRIRGGIYSRFVKTRTGFIERISFRPSIQMVMGDASSITYVLVPPTPIKQIPGKPIVPQQPTIQTNTNNYFGIMSFEFATPVSFTIKNFRLNLSPKFVKPVKLYASEDIKTKHQFVMQAGLFYTLNLY